MTQFMAEPMRIRVVMTQLRTHLQTSCDRREPWGAQDDYERMKKIVDEYPDDPDLVATLADSGTRLMDAYTASGMDDRAKRIYEDIQKLSARIKSTPGLEKKVVDFLKMAYGV